jgi:hypothetical protein
MNRANNLALAGAVVATWIPKHGFYDRGMPADLPWRYRVRGLWLELCLRVRLFFTGAYRGLKGTGVFGIGRLYASVIRADGAIEHLGLLSTKSITDAGVAYLVDDWDNDATDITSLHFHGCGTGTNAENVTDVALQTESTTALNPDNTRATGTESQPAANQLRTIGTVTFDNTAAITEHGIFSQAATGGGTLWDRSVFAAINVVSGDSIQFTYTLSVSSGG